MKGEIVEVGWNVWQKCVDSWGSVSDSEVSFFFLSFYTPIECMDNGWLLLVEEGLYFSSFPYCLIKHVHERGVCSLYRSTMHCGAVGPGGRGGGGCQMLENNIRQMIFWGGRSSSCFPSPASNLNDMLHKDKDPNMNTGNRPRSSTNRKD